MCGNLQVFVGTVSALGAPSDAVGVVRCLLGVCCAGLFFLRRHSSLMNFFSGKMEPIGVSIPLECPGKDIVTEMKLSQE